MSKSFKAGDRVRAVRSYSQSFGEVVEGQVYTVSGHSVAGNICLKEICTDRGWFPSGFELVAEEPAKPVAKFQPGDRVRCIEGNDDVVTGEEYTVVSCPGGTDRRDAMCPIMTVQRTDGSMVGVFTRRFELVTPPAFKVGDKVKVVRKSTWIGWVAEQDPFVGDGQTHSVKEVTKSGRVILMNGDGWIFPTDALELVTETPEQAEIADLKTKLATAEKERDEAREALARATWKPVVGGKADYWGTTVSIAAIEGDDAWIKYADGSHTTVDLEVLKYA